MLDPETDLQLGPDLGSRWLCAQGEWPIPEQGLKPKPVAKPVAIPVVRTTALVHPSKGSLVVGKGPCMAVSKSPNQCMDKKTVWFCFPHKD